MVKFSVATDSGCDLPARFCAERGIHAYRMKYAIGETEYSDEMDPQSCARFYDLMRSGAAPKTSQMNPQEFVNFWTGIFDAERLPIVHIAMGSAISGTCANAKIAEGIFRELRPEAEVFVVDSTLASIGYGMLCVKAANMRDDAHTPQECAQELENLKKYINTYYTTNDLKYLYRSGRVSRAGVIVATALNINPVLNLDKDGRLIVTEKIRGRKNAFERIRAIVKERAVAPEEQTVYICHSDCRPEEVSAFSDALLTDFHFRDAFISYIGPTIGSHAGPGLIAAFFEGQPRY